MVVVRGVTPTGRTLNTTDPKVAKQLGVEKAKRLQEAIRRRPRILAEEASQLSSGVVVVAPATIKHQRSVMQGVRQRMRSRGTRALFALVCLDSPYDRYGVHRSQLAGPAYPTLDRSYRVVRNEMVALMRSMLQKAVVDALNADRVKYTSKVRDTEVPRLNNTIDEVLRYFNKPLKNWETTIILQNSAFEAS